MSDEKKDILKQMKQQRSETRKQVKQDVADTMPQNTNRERMKAAMKTDLVPMVKMTDEERDLYDSIANYLCDTGLVASVDTIPLSMLVHAMLLYNTAYERVREAGFTHMPVGTNGAVAPTEDYLTMKTERKAVMDLFKDMGFDGKTRLKIFAVMAGLAEDKDDQDPFE